MNIPWSVLGRLGRMCTDGGSRHIINISNNVLEPTRSNNNNFNNTNTTDNNNNRKLKVLIKSIVLTSLCLSLSLIFVYQKFPNHCCSPMVGRGPSVGSKYEHQYCESWAGGNGIIVLSDC